MAQKDPIAEAIKKETRMQARVAKQVARMKQEIALFQPLKPYVSPKSDGILLKGIAAGIYRALDRPGVAPTTKPKSAAGGETFHFALTTVTKTSPFTRTLTGEREGAAAAHESYIEREDAPEVFEQAQARFLEQAGRVSGQTLPQDVDIAVQGQEYIERKNAVEAAARDDEALSMYGNLPADYDSRLKFWEAVEAHEAEPRHHLLSIDPAKDTETWAKILNGPIAPPEVLAAAALPPRVITTGKDDNKKSHELLGQLKLTEARAPAVHAYLKSIKGSSKFAFWTPGRGGRIQMRLIISLPYELSSDDRLALLKTFCDSQFRNLKADDGSRTDVPFWAVVHKPEATSDDRNYHAHIVFSERPAKLIPHPETHEPTWDFAYCEKKKDKFRKTRERRPFEQSKVRSLHDKGWPGAARNTYARLANELLKARGFDKILDPRSYEAMGIEAEPIQRMKPNEYAKEKKGQTSVSGDKTVDAQWQRITTNLDQRFPLKAFFPPVSQQIRFDGEIRRWKTFDHPVHYMLINARARWRKAWLKSHVLDADAAAAAVAIERIRSKYDAPGGSRLREHPEVAEFLTAMADKYVAGPRIEAANNRLTQGQMIEYANAVTNARGPVIGDTLSQQMHAAVPTVHPSKIKMVDNVVALATNFMSLVRADHDITMDDYIATVKAVRQEMPPPPKQQAPKAPAYDTSPMPVKRYAFVPPGTKTPFKSSAGRALGKVDELIFRARRITKEHEDQIRYYEWQKQDDEARLARIAAMNAERNPRITTSSLIDNRPFSAPPSPSAAARPVGPAKAAPTQAPAKPDPLPTAAADLRQRSAPTPSPRPPAASTVAPAERSPSPQQAPKPPASPATRAPVPEAPSPARPSVPQPAADKLVSPTAPRAGSPAPAEQSSPQRPVTAADNARAENAKSTEPSSSHQQQPPPRPAFAVRKSAASEPIPEPPRATDEQLAALERRKKRRRAMFVSLTQERGRTR